LQGLLGALVYFGINFVVRLVQIETVGNLNMLMPVILVLTLYVAANKDKNCTLEILTFNVAYILWLSGGHLTYLFMPLVLFSFIFVVTSFVFHGTRLSWADWLKGIKRYLLMYILPLLAVAYQYYYVYDVITSSNRLKPGLVVSLTNPEPWLQFGRSLQSSSYLKMALVLAGLAVLAWLGKRFKGWRELRVHKVGVWALVFLAVAGYFYLGGDFHRLANNPTWEDYLGILGASEFWAALLAWAVMHLLFSDQQYVTFSWSRLAVLVGLVSLLSFFFFAPQNIIGDVNGYDYDLFRELGWFSRFIFVTMVLFSGNQFSQNKWVQSLFFSAILLYLFRSHLTLLILRFTGFVWYATRDGSIFSLLFALLFVFGVQNFLALLSAKNLSRIAGYWGVRAPGKIRLAALLSRWGSVSLMIGFTLLLIYDSEYKMYQGTTHRYIYPLTKPRAASPMEAWIFDTHTETIPQITTTAIAQKSAAGQGFHRLFSPENSYVFLGGSFQRLGIYEAAIYASAISKDIKQFYEKTILDAERVQSTELRDLMPYMLFTRHVHEGLGLTYKQIRYGDFFLFNPATDKELIKKGKFDLWWDLAQVKYLLVGGDFAASLAEFPHPENYRLVEKYAKIGMSLFEIVKEKSYAREAFLPKAQGQSWADLEAAVNAQDAQKLREEYAKLQFSDQLSGNIKLVSAQRDGDRRIFEIQNDQSALFIDFESWNRHWNLTLNGQPVEVQKAFQLFKGVPLEPGVNRLEFTYQIPGFMPLLWLGMLMSLGYLLLLLRAIRSR